jgi:hypothetical protein
MLCLSIIPLVLCRQEVHQRTTASFFNVYDDEKGIKKSYVTIVEPMAKQMPEAMKELPVRVVHISERGVRVQG